MTRYLKSGDISEEQIQRTVFEYIRLHKELSKFIIHIPNEGKRSPRYGKMLKSIGMRAGVPDIFIAKSCHGYHGAWIELKSAKGKLSDAQKLFLDTMNENGYYTMTCYSIEEAINVINAYCLN